MLHKIVPFTDRKQSSQARINEIARLFSLDPRTVFHILAHIVDLPADLDRSKGQSDMHVHTDLFDGRHGKRELLMAAMYLGLKDISFTDHNIYAPITNNEAMIVEGKLKVHPGIELSGWLGVRHRRLDVHLLAYDFEHTREIQQSIQDHTYAQIEFQKSIFDKQWPKWIGMRNINGYPPQWQNEPPAVISYYQIERYIRKHTRSEAQVRNFMDNFRESMHKGKMHFGSFREIAQLVHNSGGSLVLAHPYRLIEDLQKYFCSDKHGNALQMFVDILIELKDQGLNGVEVQNYTQPAWVSRLADIIAMNFCLLGTTGSDFHKKPWQKLGVFGKE
ncbi:MAG: hypothetical protein WC838_07350 [Candidatus Margulisiibacteriota bacterium]|jgi:predicted metal-dependent phosphoesterase TrpH